MSPVSAISPQLTFLQYHLSTGRHNKIAHSASPNQLCQISLPQASMPHKIPFHHSHFNCSILIEVGQIFANTFSNVSKNHDPSPHSVQKSNRMKYDSHTKWVSHQSAIIRHETDMTLKSHWCHQSLQSALNYFSANITCQLKNITNCLHSIPLISWAKFHYHGHQWHLAPHSMTHIATVKYKQK